MTTARCVNLGAETAENPLKNTTGRCLNKITLLESVITSDQEGRQSEMPQTKAKTSRPGRSGDPAQIAFLHDMLDEMDGIARGGGHVFLGYLIGMARQEAARLARGGGRRSD